MKNTEAKTTFLATLTTAHYEFQALGLSEKDARSTLKKGWRVHQKQTNCVTPFSSYADDVRITEMTIGVCVRDCEELI